MEASLKLSFELISGHVFHKQCWASKERRSAIPFLSFPTFCSRNNICIKRIQKFEQLNHYDEHCKGSEDRYFGVGWVFSERIYPGFYLQEQRKGKKYRTCIKKKVLLFSQISYKSLHFLPRSQPWQEGTWQSIQQSIQFLLYSLDHCCRKAVNWPLSTE